MKRLVYYPFKVVAVSENTNSFGLRQMIVVNKDGTAFRTCQTGQFCPKKGDTIQVPFEEHGHYGVFNFAKLGHELTEQIAAMPKELVDEIFKEEKS